MTNLVTNAVQHTPTPTTVRVTVRTDGPNTALIVADDGPGLPDAALNRAFDRFWRADPARGPAVASGHGTGLGLAIARDIARAHGGELTLTHAAEGGLQAQLQLPRAPSRAPTPTSRQSAGR